MTNNNTSRDAAGRVRRTRPDADGRVRNMWSEEEHPAPEGIDLMGDPAAADASEKLESFDEFYGRSSRHTALINGGYVEPVFLSAITQAESTVGIDEFWEQDFLAGAHGGNYDRVPQLPDDYTPLSRAGMALDGNSIVGDRRAQRMKYEVDGWTLRLAGSVKSCHDFAKNEHRTFRVGVNATDPNGRSTQGTMLVTYGGPGLWSVTALGDDSERGRMMAAGVQAALEARRVTAIPSHIGGLAERARERIVSTGVELDSRLRSSWLDAVAYNTADDSMFTRTSNGNVYGHSVPRETFQRVKMSTSPGKMFNQYVKGSERFEVTECPKCHRVYPADANHRCRPKGGYAPTVTAATEAQHAAAARSAERLLETRDRLADRLRRLASPKPGVPDDDEF